MDGFLKVELMSRGISFPDVQGKLGGAGPSEGVKIALDGSVAHVPIAASYVRDSSFSAIQNDQGYELIKDGDRIAEFTVEPEPKFHTRRTDAGIPLSKIAVMCGDSLASTVIQRCAMWELGKACGFCGIQLSLDAGRTVAVKSPRDLAFAAKTAHDLDGLKQVTLTAGTTIPRDAGIMYLGECAKAVHDETGLPVHVQFQPPDDLDILRYIKACGVETVGIHIESFDEDVWGQVAPSKAALGQKRYEEAWKAAAQVFGPGKVQSFIIVGLGERIESVMDGALRLIELGVYPFVTPLRPIPGTSMEKSRPPNPEIMADVYYKVARALKEKNMSSDEFMAGCAACAACSALREFGA